jgi:hypothetical protein
VIIVISWLYSAWQVVVLQFSSELCAQLFKDRCNLERNRNLCHNRACMHVLDVSK